MTQLVRFPIEGGGSIVVEVVDGLAGEPAAAAEPIRGLGRTTAQDAVITATETLESAIAGIAPACRAIVRSIAAGVDAPDLVEVTFGVQFSGRFGAVFAQAASEANLSVTLTWDRHHDS